MMRFYSTFRRSSSRRAVRFLAYAIAFFTFLDVYKILGNYQTLNYNLVTNTITRLEDLPSRAQNQQIFIVAQFWTSAGILIDYWADALMHLVHVLGPDNVYVSILESGSLDNTVEVLEWMYQEFERRGIESQIIVDPMTHGDAIEAGPIDSDGKEKDGWIYTGDSDPPGQKELRRIPYLAELRNRGLKPMFKLLRDEDRVFDKILYLNDVIFKPSDVLSLLATNNGVYDVACAVDFHYPPDFYDSFVLRDSQGYPAITRQFPYFRTSKSRTPMLKGLPAPVKSCWNGMLLVDAAPYYNQTKAIDTFDVNGNPIRTKEGLKFRGLPDALASSHVEASECCLIHADLMDRGQATKGIFINPAVRVGYGETKGLDKTSYELVHRGADGLTFVTRNEYFLGVWKNRYMRWTRPAWYDMRKIWSRVNQWKKDGKAKDETREEVGVFCTVDEMQIIIWNGWKHVW